MNLKYMLMIQAAVQTIHMQNLLLINWAIFILPLLLYRCPKAIPLYTITETNISLEQKAKKLAFSFGIVLSVIDNYIARKEFSDINFTLGGEPVMAALKEIRETLDKKNIKIHYKFLESRISTVAKRSGSYISRINRIYINEIAAVFA